MEKSKSSVILAGANSEIFNNQGFKKWDSVEPLKIVTHHWSSHENKGFDIYQEINELISKKDGKIKLSLPILAT